MKKIPTAGSLLPVSRHLAPLYFLCGQSSSPQNAIFFPTEHPHPQINPHSLKDSTFKAQTHNSSCATKKANKTNVKKRFQRRKGVIVFDAAQTAIEYVKLNCTRRFSTQSVRGHKTLKSRFYTWIID